MSYLVYSSEAFVVNREERGENNCVFLYFTRDFGLVPVWGQGIRTIRAKLRCASQKYILLEADMIKGRRWWRLVDARLLSVPPPDFLPLFARTCALLTRLLGYGIPAPRLFDDMKNMYTFVAEHPPSPHDIRVYEILSVLKVLFHEGYVPHDVLPPTLQKEIIDGQWSMTGIALTRERVPYYISLINQSFLHTPS